MMSLDRRLGLPVCLVLLGALATACGHPEALTESGESGSDRRVYVDLWAKHWPELTLTDVDTLLSPQDPSVSFGAIHHPTLSHSGTVAVSDSLTNEVWVRDPGGGWTRAVAHGDGPREVRFVGGLWWTGDTLGVYDGVRHRVIRLVDGADPLDHGVRTADPDQVAARRLVLGRGEEVILSVALSVGPESAEGIHRPPISVLRIDREGRVGKLGTWPGRAWMRRATGYGPQPFGVRTFVGGFGRRVFVADGAGRRVVGIDLDTDTVIEWRWRDARTPVSRDLRNRWVKAALESVPAPQRPAAKVVLRDVPLPDSLPTVGNLLAGPDGVWIARWYPDAVERFGRRRPATDWRILPLRDGAEPTRFHFDQGVTPAGLTEDGRVLLLLEDELGRQGLAVARMAEGPGD